MERTPNRHFCHWGHFRLSCFASAAMGKLSRYWAVNSNDHLNGTSRRSAQFRRHVAHIGSHKAKW
jgi:hypothetical protein